MAAGAAAAGAAAVGGTVAAGAATAAGSAAVANAPSTARSAAPVAVTPGDRRYLDLVRGWNQRWVGAPEAVYVVRSAAEVARVVQLAADRGKRLTVRGGGHCWEDFVFNPEVDVVVDMSEMAAVRYDPGLHAFSVEGGARLLDVYERLYRMWGVTIPAGTCYSVGVGGHVSGGGWGMLLRRDGLVVDHLYAVEVVVVGASGKVRTVVATREKNDPNRELWWAHTGGGGGNFGVVTRYWFRSPGRPGRRPESLLPQPPAEVLISAASWAWDDLGEADFVRLVKNFANWHVAHGEPDDPRTAICSLLSLNHRSNGAVGIVTQVDASVRDAEGLHAEFMAAVTKGVRARTGPVTTQMGEFAAMPEFAQPQRLPWMQATQYIGTANATTNNPTLKGDFKSAYMRASFPERHLRVLYEHLSRGDLDNPTASLMLSSHGGRANAVPANATAFPHRSALFKMAWMIWWTDPADEARSVGWLREFYEDLYADTGGVPVPNGVTDGCYVNYPDVDLGDARRNTSAVPWHELYYKGNYARLQQVKKAYDPKDFFRHRQSVRLPS
ncbi:FAD-binding oxidoreductase [Streptomyces sp. ventii]|uniref:FAD-binding oxidoreductase n=1 Tax=Streptomyces spiramenti TaxID=2720606 RepID=A0ABX1ALI6_9ACTN|nr:FAD-binding oxidoreductase [Streptomyces spiramenti]NJP65493.1 FAD-binding oxidoreductase [Streptomyces spiramenti]